MPEKAEYYEIGDILVVPYSDESQGIVVVSSVHCNKLYPQQSLYEGIYYDVGADCPESTSFLGHEVIGKNGNVFDIIPNAKKDT